MKKRKIIIISLLGLCLAGILAVGGINIGMYAAGNHRITPPGEAPQDIDCVLVLGCQVKSDGSPSHMLEDRLKAAVGCNRGDTLFLMSGDHGQEDYNEVAVMKQYAIDAGVPSENIFMDHAGFSTYESIYRAKHIFGARRILIVTQKYHLYRALHIANALDLEAWGIAADARTYSGQFYREIREVLARVKDFGMSILMPEPIYLGDPIPLSGSGDITND